MRISVCASHRQAIAGRPRRPAVQPACEKRPRLRVSPACRSPGVHRKPPQLPSRFLADVPFHLSCQGRSCVYALTCTLQQSHRRCLARYQQPPLTSAGANGRVQAAVKIRAGCSACDALRHHREPTPQTQFPVILQSLFRQGKDNKQKLAPRWPSRRAGVRLSATRCCEGVPRCRPAPAATAAAPPPGPTQRLPPAPATACGDAYLALLVQICQPRPSTNTLQMHIPPATRMLHPAVWSGTPEHIWSFREWIFVVLRNGDTRGWRCTPHAETVRPGVGVMINTSVSHAMPTQQPASTRRRRLHWKASSPRCSGFGASWRCAPSEQ